MATWLDIPGLPGYQIRDDWREVRSLTRRIWKFNGYSLRDRDEMESIRMCSQAYQQSLLKTAVVKGQKLTPMVRKGITYYQIYGGAFSINRIRKAVKNPVTAPIRPLYPPYRVEVV